MKSLLRRVRPRGCSMILFFGFLFVFVGAAPLNISIEEQANSTPLTLLNLTAKAPSTSNVIQKIPLNVTTEAFKPTNFTTTTINPLLDGYDDTTTEIFTTTTADKPPDKKLPTEVIVNVEDIQDLLLEPVDPCPKLSTLSGLDNLTQDEFLSKLTDGCRFDRLIKPPTKGPLQVDVQIDMKHIESADHLQFKSHILVQVHYKDIRLEYSKISPKRGNILGEEPLRNKIWVPHIVIVNERDSSLMGLDGKDLFVQVSPSGDVIYSYRMTTTFYCWMNLQKFPFDYQICEITWTSWAYNNANLKLNWRKNRPFQVAPNLHLTEFVLEEKWTEETNIPSSFSTGGLSGGNYSAILFKFKLRREVGYYIMDYFLPSILLVCMSWVTFWLQADASPPRITLGSATMLSFITLNGGLTKNLPKVSYIKASEIWFLGCATFIFCSMCEFAFVNVIWRRKKKVELKKQNSKHILKGAITPSLARKQLRKAESINILYKTRSCSSLDGSDGNETKNTQANYLTVHSFPSSLHVPTITMSHDELIGDSEESVTTYQIPNNGLKTPMPTPTAWTTMTPQEVAIWIDKKSRVVFPVAFLIFNLFYWSFVYAL